MVSFMTAAGAILAVQRQTYKIVCFKDVDSGPLILDTSATIGGKQGMNRQGRKVIMIYKSTYVHGSLAGSAEMHTQVRREGQAQMATNSHVPDRPLRGHRQPGHRPPGRRHNGGGRYRHRTACYDRTATQWQWSTSTYARHRSRNRGGRHGHGFSATHSTHPPELRHIRTADSSHQEWSRHDTRQPQHRGTNKQVCTSPTTGSELRGARQPEPKLRNP